MSDDDLKRLNDRPNVAPWRLAAARAVESPFAQRAIIGLIIANAAILGMETSPTIVEAIGPWLRAADKLCLAAFILELLVKLVAYRSLFWRSGWNVFDFLVVAIAVAPGAGPWAVLRSLRILRVLRLLTVVPQLRKVVAAFLHSIPGLSGVVFVMLIFFYTASVLSTNLFGDSFPQWFGSIDRSLFSLFQIMTLESWSMGIVRPLMEVYPWAWAFFVPFIVIATFTILNLFIGIIVSTMTELATMPDPRIPDSDLPRIIERMERDLKDLRSHIERR